MAFHVERIRLIHFIYIKTFKNTQKSAFELILGVFD